MGLSELKPVVSQGVYLCVYGMPRHTPHTHRPLYPGSTRPMLDTDTHAHTNALGPQQGQDQDWSVMLGSPRLGPGKSIRTESRIKAHAVTALEKRHKSGSRRPECPSDPTLPPPPASPLPVRPHSRACFPICTMGKLALTSPEL